jgi:hypothetical protein
MTHESKTTVTIEIELLKELLKIAKEYHSALYHDRQPYCVVSRNLNEITEEVENLLYNS